MKICVLQYFMAVARHENITKAAEELHLTQPTEAGLMTDIHDESAGESQPDRKDEGAVCQDG